MIALHTTHMRVGKKALETLKIMSSIEGKTQVQIVNEMVEKREKELHNGNARRAD